MNFCTLFDSYYIHKGIALYLSLEKVTEDFHLYVMAFDKDCYDKLRSCSFRHMTVELSDNFETPDLLAVKPTRTKAEYCWTCGPSVIHHFLTAYQLSEITYIDADLYFLADPQSVFEEIGQKSIAITEQYIDYSEGGKYCVQFMYFRNDRDGRRVLEWWRDRCIEWCYSRYEDGKFGDQKYLEQFELLSDNVHVVQNRGVGIAPWNIHLYSYRNNFLIYKDREYPCVFFHMHGTKVTVKGSRLILNAIDCEINEQTRDLFFSPYAQLLSFVYNNYLGITVNRVNVIGQNRLQMIIAMIRGKFRSNKIASFIWYRILRKKYNGYEKKKL